MRTDATIDRKQVKLPYRGPCTGFDKYKAQYGDTVVFKSGTQEYIGRVAGRIAYAPAIADDQKPVKNWLLVITFAQGMTSVFEYWVDPENVIRCFPTNAKTLRLFQFVFSDEFKQHSPDELRQWSQSGFSTLGEYQVYLNRHNVKG